MQKSSFDEQEVFYENHFFESDNFCDFKIISFHPYVTTFSNINFKVGKFTKLDLLNSKKSNI